MGIVSQLFAAVFGLIIGSIAALGYAGVVALMALESAGIPLPSEIIMPFSGYLVLRGDFTLLGAALAGAAGCLLGSLGAYWISAAGGRRLLERYGRYVLISRHDIEIAHRWFARHGDATVFIGRLLPLVRTYISFPAGVARMNVWRFTFYTFVGSLIWTYVLALAGLRLGENWATIRQTFERFDLVIGIAIVIAAVWWVRRHLSVRDL